MRAGFIDIRRVLKLFGFTKTQMALLPRSEVRAVEAGFSKAAGLVKSSKNVERTHVHIASDSAGWLSEG